MLTIKMEGRHRVLLKVAAKGQERPALTGVRITSKYAEATDGYMLLQMPVEAVDGIDDGEGAIIPARALALGLTGLKKTTNIEVTITEDIAEIEHGDILVKASLLKAAFPDTERLMVTRKPHDGVETFVVAIAPKILKRLAEIAQAVGSRHVRFQMTSPTSPIGVQFDGGVRATIMPVFPGNQ